MHVRDDICWVKGLCLCASFWITNNILENDLWARNLLLKIKTIGPMLIYAPTKYGIETLFELKL